MIYISCYAHAELIEYLRRAGHAVTILAPDPAVGPLVSTHPDIFMCKKYGVQCVADTTTPTQSAYNTAQRYITPEGYITLPSEAYNCARSAPCIIYADKKILGPAYPRDIPYNAVWLERYFIHNLKYTAPDLLRAADAEFLTLINVRQGYTKCSVAVVTGSAIITADEGIYNAVRPLPDLDVLKVRPADIKLRYAAAASFRCVADTTTPTQSAYNTAQRYITPEGHITPSQMAYNCAHSAPCGSAAGFIGGATGLVDGALIVNGDLSRHPDAAAIRAFCADHGVEVIDFHGLPLVDIGTIIQA